MSRTRKNPIEITKELLVQKYHVEKLSIKQISIDLKQTFGTIVFYVKKYELKSPFFTNRKPRDDTKFAKFTKELTKELAIDYYINQQMSTTDIANMFESVSAWTVNQQLVLLGIEIRNKEDRITDKVREKLRNVVHEPNAEANALRSLRNKGRKASQEEKDRRRATQKRGPDNPLYKGNQPFIDSVRKTARYNDWRIACFVRDKRTCLLCGFEKKKMNVDHIKPFSSLLKEYNIITLEQALACEGLWDINNGRVLCVECHKGTDTYGEGAKKYMDNYKMENISLKDLAIRIGINDFDSPEEYDISGEKYEILSYDIETGKEVWKPILNFVVKPSVDEHYQINTLHGTGEHRIFSNEKKDYIALKDDPRSELVKQKMQVVDITVQDTNCYIAEGFINHNTTPGGMSIPYICSTRLRITSTGQSKIEDSKGNIIGIKVKAKTIKNKVAKPFRECEFQILFGVGIKEHEEVFDLFREYCSSSKEKGIIMPNGHKVSVEGAGAWKNFLVHDKDGEVIEDVKCYKAEFGTKVLYKPEYSQYMEALFEATLIMKSPSAENITYVGPDLDSAEEAMELIRNDEEEKRQVLNG